MSFKRSFERVHSEAFEDLSYRGHNPPHLLLGQLAFILLQLRMAPVVGYIGELNHLPSTFVNDLDCDFELVINSTLAADVDKCGVTFDIFYFVDSYSAEVVHLSRQVLGQEGAHVLNRNDLFNS